MWRPRRAGGGGAGLAAVAAVAAAQAGTHLAQRDCTRVRASIRRAVAKSGGRLQLARALGVTLACNPKQGSGPQGQRQRQEFVGTHLTEGRRAEGAHTGFKQSYEQCCVLS